MQTECIPDLFGLVAVDGRPVVAAFDGGRSPRTPRRCCSAQPIGRLGSLMASRPASVTRGRRSSNLASNVVATGLSGALSVTSGATGALSIPAGTGSNTSNDLAVRAGG